MAYFYGTMASTANSKTLTKTGTVNSGITATVSSAETKCKVDLNLVNGVEELDIIINDEIIDKYQLIDGVLHRR